MEEKIQNNIMIQIVAEYLQGRDLIQLLNLLSKSKTKSNFIGNLKCLCSDCDNNDIVKLSILTDIRYLDLEGTDYVYINPITRLTHLTHLSLHNLTPIEMEYNILSYFENLQNLRYLDLYGMIKLYSTVNILSLTKLTHLNLGKCHFIKDTGIDLISQYLTNLNYLDLSGTNYHMVRQAWSEDEPYIISNTRNDDGLRSVSNLTNLTHLSLANLKKFSDRGWRYISTLSNLKYLDINHTNISDSGLKLILKLINLEYLDISFSDKINSLTGISELSHLTHLNLEDNENLNDDTIYDILKLTNLRYLNINNTNIKNLQVLFSLPSRLELVLNRTLFTHLSETEINNIIQTQNTQGQIINILD